MDVKPGYKTTEFWVTIASLVVSVLVGFGVIPQEQAEELNRGLQSLIAAVFAVLPVGLYIWSRAKVKARA